MQDSEIRRPSFLLVNSRWFISLSIILVVVVKLPRGRLMRAIFCVSVDRQSNQLALFIIFEQVSQVLGIILLMYMVSGAIVIWKLRSADPANIF